MNQKSFINIILIVVIIILVVVGISYAVLKFKKAGPGKDINQTSEIDTSNWKTYRAKGFEFKYPSDWNMFGGRDIECASGSEFIKCQFDRGEPRSDKECTVSDLATLLELTEFGACWEEEVGGKELSFSQTYHRFLDGFIHHESVPDKTITITDKTIGGNKVQIIKYENINQVDTGVIMIDTAGSGTVALWQKDDIVGYVLLDRDNKNQENGIFDKILSTLKFTD